MAIVRAVGATGTEYLEQVKLAEGWRIINILSEPRAEPPFRFTPSGVIEPPVDEAQSGAEDEAAVLEMANGYLTGWCSGDRALLSRHLHPSLSKKTLREDNEGRFFLDNFNYPKYTAWAGGPAQPRASAAYSAARADFTVLDRTRETASVRIDWNLDEQGVPQSLEYVGGAKVDGRWLVVNLLWGSGHGVSDAPWACLYW